MSRKSGKCILCGYGCAIESDFDTKVSSYECPSCGDFTVTREASEEDVAHLSQPEKHKLGACMREHKILGLPPLTLSNSPRLSSGFVTTQQVLDNLFPQSIEDRLSRTMANLCRLTSAPGMPVTLEEYDRLPVTFAESQETANFMLSQLESLGYIRMPRPGKGLTGPRRALTVTALGLSMMSSKEDTPERPMGFRTTK
jgi:predicted RNA-binding Zn-ribbon protein involved in translation (DUF1610 family)